MVLLKCSFKEKRNEKKKKKKHLESKVFTIKKK